MFRVQYTIDKCYAMGIHSIKIALTFIQVVCVCVYINGFMFNSCGGHRTTSRVIPYEHPLWFLSQCLSLPWTTHVTD